YRTDDAPHLEHLALQAALIGPEEQSHEHHRDAEESAPEQHPGDQGLDGGVRRARVAAREHAHGKGIPRPRRVIESARYAMTGRNAFRTVVFRIRPIGAVPNEAPSSTPIATGATMSGWMSPREK